MTCKMEMSFQILALFASDCLSFSFGFSPLTKNEKFPMDFDPSKGVP